MVMRIVNNKFPTCIYQNSQFVYVVDKRSQLIQCAMENNDILLTIDGIRLRSQNQH